MNLVSLINDWNNRNNILDEKTWDNCGRLTALCGDDSDSRISDSYTTHSLDGDIKRQESGECVALSTQNKNSENSRRVQNFDVELMCGIKSYGILACTQNHRKKTQYWWRPKQDQARKETRWRHETQISRFYHSELRNSARLVLFLILIRLFWFFF